MVAKTVPAGFHSVTPNLVVKGAGKAIEFYKKVFGAQELSRMPGPDGTTIMHAEIKIGDSIVMLNDEFPQMGARGPQSLGGSPVTIHLYVDDVDAVFAKATAAGATTTMPVADMFWGDRYGQLTDPFGHHWSIGTHMKDLTSQEMQQAAAAAFSAPSKSCC